MYKLTSTTNRSTRAYDTFNLWCWYCRTVGSATEQTLVYVHIGLQLHMLNWSNSMDARVVSLGKYDRQIRIWGEHGQTALEDASVCVINAGPTGTETLKNLVLPGIRSFTLLDGGTVAPPDLGNNFFLSESDLGVDGKQICRAEAAARSVLELNDQVQGSFIREKPESFLSSSQDAAKFFQKFSIVIVTQLGVDDPLTKIIARGCNDAKVPLIVVRAYGLLGLIRIQIPEICVLDARQEGTSADLRLQNPFPALMKYVNSVDLSTITDSAVAAHVPFVVILIKALAEFRSSFGKPCPSSREEKDALKSIVNSLRPSCCTFSAENFQEALKQSNLRLCFADAATDLDQVQRILHDSKAELCSSLFVKTTGSPPRHFPSLIKLSSQDTSSEKSNPAEKSTATQFSTNYTMSCRLDEENLSFWLHVAAVRKFMKENNLQLPLSGVVPDMTADTVSYVELQRVYSTKARSDATEVLKHANQLCDQHNLPYIADEVTVSSFCRRLAGIRVMRYRTIEDEVLGVPGSNFMESLELNGLTDSSTEHAALPYYALIRAADQFRVEHGWYPGEKEGLEESDLRLLRDCVAKVKSYFACNLPASLWFDEAEEIVRFGNVELHNVAAFMGGIAAQEAAKILTRQFVPLNNSLIVNFSTMTSSSFVA